MRSAPSPPPPEHRHPNPRTPHSSDHFSEPRELPSNARHLPPTIAAVPMNPSRSTPDTTRAWLPALAAGLVLALVVGVGVFAGGSGSDAGADEPTTEATIDAITGTTAPGAPEGIANPTPDTPAAAPAPPLAGPVSIGSAGDDVRRCRNVSPTWGSSPGRPTASSARDPAGRVGIQEAHRRRDLGGLRRQ